MALELLVNKSELRSSVSGSTPTQKVRVEGMVIGSDSRHGNRYREADGDTLRAKIPSIFAKFVSSQIPTLFGHWYSVIYLFLFFSLFLFKLLRIFL